MLVFTEEENDHNWKLDVANQMQVKWLMFDQETNDLQLSYAIRHFLIQPPKIYHNSTLI